MKADIGIIGAMSVEIDALVSKLENKEEENIGGVLFNTGRLFGKKIVVAKCGIGKVFAAIAAEAMIIKYSPSIIVNTGVGGALSEGLLPTNIVIAERLCQHDMDTTPFGDPKGFISGINKVWFESDKRAVRLLFDSANELGLVAKLGDIASGDKFIAGKEEKERIVKEFFADVCEMEGASVAQTAYVNSTPFVVIRAISDSADGSANMNYAEFLELAASNSARLTEELIKKW